MFKTLFCGALIVLAAAAEARADAESDFAMLFGDQYKAVLGTPSRDDDLALADKIVKAGQSMSDAPKSQALMYRKAFDLAVEAPAGGRTAIQALKLLEAAAPGNAQYQAMRIRAMRREYEGSEGAERRASADRFIEMLSTQAQVALKADDPAAAVALYNEALKVAMQLQDSDLQQKFQMQAAAAERLQRDSAARRSKLAALTAKLAANPADAAARTEAILFCLVDLDDPDKAQSLLHSSVAAELRQRVEAAAAGVSKADEARCMDLAQWYLDDLLARAGAAPRDAMAQRAQAYAKRYLELHRRHDAARVKAQQLLDRVARLRQGPEAPPHSDVGPAATPEPYVTTLAPLPPNCVLVLPMDYTTMFRDKNQALIRDLSGKDHHVQMTGGQFGNGRARQGFVVKKSGEGIVLPTIPAMRGATFSYWLNIEPTDIGYNSLTLLGGPGNNGQVRMHIRRGSRSYYSTSIPPLRLYVTVEGASLSPYTVDLPDKLAGRWTHLAVTLDVRTAKFRVYFDGAVQSEGAVQSTSYYGSDNSFKSEFTFSGATLGNPQARDDAIEFKGVIDEVLLFSRALSEDEVRQLYRMGVASRSAGTYARRTATAPPVEPAKQQPAPAAPAGKELALTLPANTIWTAAGTYQKGQIVFIKARGLWKIRDAHGTCTADGRVFDWSGEVVMGALRGRVGQGKPFKVGSNLRLEVPQDGVLELGMDAGDNDYAYEKNSGQLSVTVRTSD
ncbi:MAG: hypothetical protein LLG01_17620 [Planctomycetaceae bacterium]|nr:hypothetical protein [Planctomycetaceae bacterium]